MTVHDHLSEQERHEAAEGALPPERVQPVRDHLDACDACAADVARIETLVRRAREAPAPVPALDDAWPSIRERIERRKVVPLAADAASDSARGAAGRWVKWGAAAATIIAVVAAALLWRSSRVTPPTTASRDSAAVLISITDSAKAYQEEAQLLLDQLELRRAMLRPEAATAIDRDLRVIDSAIAELQDAIAHDPDNPTLRRLLAASYRQKVEILKRIGNAG